MTDNRQSDRQIIDRFYESVSYKDECSEIILDDRLVVNVKQSTYLSFPCHWEDLAETLDRACWWHYKMRCDAIFLILYGEPSSDKVASIIYKCADELGEVVPHFLDVRAQLDYSHFLFSSLDGIDWGEAIQKVVIEKDLSYTPKELQTKIASFNSQPMKLVHASFDNSVCLGFRCDHPHDVALFFGNYDWEGEVNLVHILNNFGFDGENMIGKNKLAESMIKDSIGKEFLVLKNSENSTLATTFTPVI